MTEHIPPDQLQDALAHFRRRATGLESASQLASEMAAHLGGEKKDESSVVRQLALARALLEGGRITAEEYVLYVSLPIEHIHEDRRQAGAYDAELSGLDERITEIEERYGLPEGHYWLKGDAPEEHRRANEEYEEILERHFINILREFGEFELADLRQQNPDRYDAMRESARKNVFERENVAQSLIDLVSIYEAEATKAAAGEAFFAAAIMLGSATECRLLMKTKDNFAEATSIFDRLPINLRRKQTRNPLGWDFKTLIAIAAEAGWLGGLGVTEYPFYTRGLADLVRLNRNMVHPARYIKERPFLDVGRELFDDAKASYVLLRDTLK